MKELLADAGLKRNSKALARFVPKMLKRTSRMREERKQAPLKIGVFDQSAVLNDAMRFLSERFNVQVVVFDQEDTQSYYPRQRSATSAAYRFTIYVE